MTFDFQLYTINLESGQPRPELPGFLAQAGDKRAARNRREDFSAILLTMAGNAPLTHPLLQEVIQRALEVYFHSDGSVTAGMRQVVEYLNRYLLTHNQKSSPQGTQLVGILNLAIFHDTTIYLGHSGLTHTFLTTKTEFQDFYDPSSDRGLGISEATPLRLFQNTATPDTLVIFAPDPPKAWTGSSLMDSASLSLDALHRRLVNQAGSELQTATLRLVNGTGQIFWRKITPSSLPVQEKPQAFAEENIPTPVPVVAEVQSPSIEPEPAAIISSTPESPTKAKPEHINIRPETIVPRHGQPLRSKPAKKNSRDGLRKTLASWWLSGKKFKKNVGSGAQKVTSKVVPGLKIKTPTLSSSTMLFIAISIPLVIVTIGATVYIQRGRSVRHQYYLQQTQEMVVYAQSEPDRNMQLIYWQQAMGFLIQAEDNGKSAQSQYLHSTIQSNLDALQGIIRVTMQPALSENLPGTVNITKIVSSYDGIYALDAAGGRILHFTRKDQSTFQVDYSFACGPVGGSLNIGPLQDMIILPINDITLDPDKPAGASVLGIDTSGNLLYCASGKNPISKTLPAPTVGWGKIQAITLNEENATLYVLDVKTSRVWIYESNDLLFTSAPIPFFDKKQPKDLAHMTSLAVNGNDLYLLNENNTMTRCVYSILKEIKETECPEDPVLYQDLRGTDKGQPLNLNGIQFISMQLIRLPDSALYLLNIKEPALYKFGFQLNLFKTIQFSPNPDTPTPTTAVSGFGLSSDQLVFLAFGNQVYFGQIP